MTRPRVASSSQPGDGGADTKNEGSSNARGGGPPKNSATISADIPSRTANASLSEKKARSMGARDGASKGPTVTGSVTKRIPAAFAASAGNTRQTNST